MSSCPRVTNILGLLHHDMTISVSAGLMFKMSWSSIIVGIQSLIYIIRIAVFDTKAKIILEGVVRYF